MEEDFHGVADSAGFTSLFSQLVFRSLSAAWNPVGVFFGCNNLRQSSVLDFAYYW